EENLQSIQLLLFLQFLIEKNPDLATKKRFNEPDYLNFLLALNYYETGNYSATKYFSQKINNMQPYQHKLAEFKAVIDLQKPVAEDLEKGIKNRQLKMSSLSLLKLARIYLYEDNI